jgi:YD repeat-containing protein
VISPDGNTNGIDPCGTNSSYPNIVDPTKYPSAAAYQTTYSFDSVGEVVSTTTPATAADPSGATTTETYDPAGNTLTRIDPNGTTTTWTYTPLSKEATVSYCGGSASSVSYSYDADGNQVSMTDATGTSSYVYDSFDELTSETNGAEQTIS